MEFNPNKSIEILSRTPQILENILGGLSDDWTLQNEGENTWSPFDVIGHLIHGERTDWPARIEIILSDKIDKTFTPFDRFAQFEESKEKNILQLLAEFRTLREKNLLLLKSKQLTPNELSQTGIHPVFGEVTLAQLLATWTAHDLGHIGQIVRVMAKQYTEAVGPWKQYLPVLTR